jgi:hypothetical protein
VETPSLGRLALNHVNIALFGFSVVLLLAGLMLSIIAGGMETINGQAEKNFPELRSQMEAEDPGYCSKAVDGVQEPMTHEECRAKLTVELEGRVLVAGVIAGKSSSPTHRPHPILKSSPTPHVNLYLTLSPGVVAVGLLASILLTLRTVRDMKGTNGDGESSPKGEVEFEEELREE